MHLQVLYDSSSLGKRDVLCILNNICLSCTWNDEATKSKSENDLLWRWILTGCSEELYAALWIRNGTAGQTPVSEVKRGWTVQNKQAGWCHPLMGTSVQTEERSCEEVPQDVCEREPDRDREMARGQGRVRWKGIWWGARCQTFTAMSLLEQWKGRTQPSPAYRGTHREAILISTRKKDAVAQWLVNLQPSWFNEAWASFLLLILLSGRKKSEGRKHNLFTWHMSSAVYFVLPQLTIVS